MGAEMVAFLESVLSGLDCLDCLAETGGNPKVSGRAVRTSVDVWTPSCTLSTKLGKSVTKALQVHTLRSQSRRASPKAAQGFAAVAGRTMRHSLMDLNTARASCEPQPPPVARPTAGGGAAAGGGAPWISLARPPDPPYCEDAFFPPELNGTTYTGMDLRVVDPRPPTLPPTSIHGSTRPLGL